MKVSLTNIVRHYITADTAVKPEPLKIKGLKISQEILEGRLFKTYKNKSDNKLVRTVFYTSDKKPAIITVFENGLPSEEFIYDVLQKGKKKLLAYRGFINGVSTCENLTRCDKKGLEDIKLFRFICKLK